MGLVLMAAACERDIVGGDERTFNITSRIEGLYNANNAKVYLQDERWIYWEVGDLISIGSNKNNCEGDKDHTFTARLINIGDLEGEENQADFGYFNGVFVTTMEWGSEYFLGLHPQNDKNIIQHGTGSNFDNIRVMLPQRQTLRHDYTFAKQMLPMVGWYGGTWTSDATAYNLDFHSLGTLVRLQVYNATNTDYTLDSIIITSRDARHPLSGLFKVKDDTYKTEDPYLDDNSTNLTETKNNIVLCKMSSGAPASLNLSLPATDGGTGVDTAQMRTFYLVLPAFKSRHDSTVFKLTMTLYADGGTKTCTRNFSVKTSRGGITYLNAIGVDNWETHHGNIGLTGNGTEARPFKIYTIEDLQKVRDAYNNGYRINNIPLTSNTWFRVMRSDIGLSRTNWTSGIRNFVGHFTMLNHQSNPGIVDTCYDVPLFESIEEGGVVEGVTLKCASVFSQTNATGVSPFCTQNNGIIRNCVVTTAPGVSRHTRSIFSSFAGICVTNNGTIDACLCEDNVEVQDGKNFAGICLINNGTITSCQASDMTVNVTGQAAGICYSNASLATVKDCYFASVVSGSTAHWAGIVYENSGTVEHCYFSSTGSIYTSKGVGGIVRRNLAGKVDYCWVAAALQGATAGGIVDSLKGGKVINCFNSASAMITLLSDATANVAGGLVAFMSDGSIENSYVNGIYLSRQDVNDPIGGIVGKATGGTCNNCYARESNHVFYGTTSGTTYNNCCLVDGSQASIGHNFTASNYEDLQTLLNGHKPTGGKTWEGAVNNSTPPHLEAYRVTSKRR